MDIFQEMCFSLEAGCRKLPGIVKDNKVHGVLVWRTSFASKQKKKRCCVNWLAAIDFRQILRVYSWNRLRHNGKGRWTRKVCNYYFCSTFVYSFCVLYTQVASFPPKLSTAHLKQGGIYLVGSCCVYSVWRKRVWSICLVKGRLIV